MTTLLRSEEDVRTKIVVPWLRENGFAPDELSLEFTFKIKVGRAVLKVTSGITSRDLNHTTPPPSHSTYVSRADILVRNSDQQNLLIVEVKAPGEPLDDATRDQGISYARAIAEGNIPPFVVLTNGKDAKVFDSLSKKEIIDDGAMLSERCRKGDFLPDAGDLAIRAEALESLISFSSTNLIAFCEAQTKFRMKALMSDDIDSDKKYIPDLYVNRDRVSAVFQRLLDTDNRRVVLLIGYPQVGKTNFVCHTVLERLAHGQACLFYPAIGLRQSLLEEISDDFEWTFGAAPDTHSLLIRKIDLVLRRLKTRLTIFIDGWNEANIQLARVIDAECSRLASERIQIVISLTNTAAVRLLKGHGGNPSFLAEEAGIPSRGAQLIEIDPQVAAKSWNWSCVYVTKYSQDECNKAYDTYSSAYGVQIPPSHIRSADPYLVGMAMKLSRGGSLPERFDEPQLLSQVIKNKSTRAPDLDSYNVLLSLRVLAQEMLEAGSPVPIEMVSKIWGLPLSQKLPEGFFDSALLARETDELGTLALDFYYGRERDYCIAYLAQNWIQQLRARQDMSSEFTKAVKTNAGADALRWFLQQPSHLEFIRREDGEFLYYEDNTVREILLSALCELVYAYPSLDVGLSAFAISCAMNDQSPLVRLQAFKLVVLVTEDAEDLIKVLGQERSLEDFIVAALRIGEEYPLHVQSAGQVVLDALRSLHWDSAAGEDGGSEVTDILADLCDDTSSYLRKQANSCFGYVAPFEYIHHVAERIKTRRIGTSSEECKELLEGISNADDGLGSAYYGDMCPGSLEAILEDPDTQEFEYKKMAPLLGPIIAVFGPADVPTFESILEDLGRGLTVEPAESLYFVDVHTLPLPFGQSD